MNPTRFVATRAPAALTALVAASLLAGCAVPVTRTTHVYDPPYRYGYAPPPPPVYVRYGTVQRIDVTDTRVGETGAGAGLGAVIGGVVGNQFGRGGGRAAMTMLGVFGGAVAGNQIERNEAAAQSSRVFHVHVSFDDGAHQVFDYADVAGLHSGERVKIENGVLTRA